MRQRYPYYTIWEKNIVSIIHYYGARAIFLLLNDNQDTESQSQDIKLMYLDQYSPIKISKPLWDNDIHTTQYGRKNLQFFIFMELEPFSYYFVITKILNLSHVNKEMVWLKQHSPIKKIKGYTG